MADLRLPSHSSYSKTFESLCAAKQLSAAELLRLSGVSNPRFLSSLAKASGPQLSSLQQICKFLNISVDSFLTGFVDQSWLLLPALPEKYLFSPGSKFRTSLTVLDYVRLKQGDVFLENVLRQLKIPPSLMDKPDEKVSIRLLADLLTHLSRRGFIAHDFIKMGWHSVSLGANAPLSMHFKGLSQMGVFEKLIDEVAHVYEENFDYRIVKATSRSIQVRSTLKASKTEDFKTNKVDNLFVSYYRQGVFAAHLKHAGYPIANSTFLSSIHLGHDTEDFSLSW